MGSPKQSGSATNTTTTSNKTADTLLPYTTYGLDSGKSIFQSNQDSNPDTNNYANQGYQNLGSVSTSGATADTTNKALNSLDYGLDGGYGVSASPSYGSLYDSSYGTSSYQQGGDKAANGLYSLAYTDNPAYDTSSNYLSDVTNGKYLNSNPYIDDVYNTSAKAITDKYQTATAPNTDSTYESSGRYGSGSALNAQGMNEKALGSSLDSLAADTYYKNYNDERKLQNTAANDLGTLGLNNTKLQGSLLDSAGTQYGTLQSGKTTAANDLQSGYNTGNQNTLTSLAYYPSTQKETFYPATQETTAGQGLISQPYYNTKQYQSLLPTGYGSSTSGSSTNPIYGPSAASTGTSLLGSGTSLYNSLGGSSLFGGGSTAATAFDSGAALDAGLGSAGFGADLAAAAPAAASTIICTELMKQGRMPRQWWRASIRDWIPDIVHRGYLVWARPSVRHLQRHPYSLYSRALCVAFNWRGEDAAARHGFDKNARRLWRGRAVTVALALPCLALGVMARLGGLGAASLRRA